jgi:iron complex outermembrane receptor protein
LTGLKEKVQLYPNEGVQVLQIEPGDDPAQTWMLRSSFDLPHQVELDLNLRHVSALSNPDVPAYTAFGCRLAWQASKNLELSVTGQNLGATGHGEFTDVATRTELGRTVYFKVIGRF